MKINKRGTRTISALIITSACLFCCFAEDKSNGQYELFFTAISDMGGSVLESLIKKCNRLDDRDIPSNSRNLKMSIMERLSGRIGPVEYKRMVRTKTTTSYGSIGTFQGTTAWGTPVVGDIMGTTSSTRTKVGGYKTIVPKGFQSAFEKLERLARNKHARSCSEVGACMFVGATKGQIGTDDRRALDYFKRAMDYGDIDGMFMYAFCLYYGIGSATGKTNKSKAYEVLQAMRGKIDKNFTGASTVCEVISNGWVARRLEEAVFMVKSHNEEE